MGKRLKLPDIEICRKYLNGMSTVELAKEYGCSDPTIANRLHKNGIKIRSLSEACKGKRSDKNHPRYIEIPTKEICEKYLNGMSINELTKEYNVNKSVIRKRLHDNNIKIRSSSKTNKDGRMAKENNGRYIDISIEEISKKYLNGMNPYQLAKEYGCSPPTIINKLRDNNIKIRSNSEAQKGKKLSQEERERRSASLQGIPYDEWESFASEHKYCPLFDEECRESNREKYGRRCFLTGLPESENITKTGKIRKLSVHHYDMDKMQGCDGKKWKLVPLCMKYHAKAHSKLWEARITWLIKNIWN